MHLVKPRTLFVCQEISLVYAYEKKPYSRGKYVFAESKPLCDNVLLKGLPKGIHLQGIKNTTLKLQEYCMYWERGAFAFLSIWD